MPGHFNPLSPHGERHAGLGVPHPPNPFQSTLPAWGETLRRHRRKPRPSRFQSTLPAWGETQGPAGDHHPPGHDFNPLSPHGERPEVFESRATLERISIHSPRMGRDGLDILRQHHGGRNFNPLSPHGERPTPSRASTCCTKAFQSTLPAWGETTGCPCRRPPKEISIHSPRMGRDRCTGVPFPSSS